MDEDLKCPQCGAERSGPEAPCSSCSWIPDGYELDNEKKEWFYIVKSRYKGPFTAPKMRELIRDATILEDTLIWQEGKQLATTAGKSPFRDEFLVPIVPSPLKLLNDKFAECMAVVVPFICIILSAFLKANIVSYVILAAVYFGLNGWFLLLDLKQVKKVGFDIMEPWMYIGIVFPPLYLLPRAIRTNKKIIYSIAWCIFALVFFLR